jgi:hypothetical protein
MTYSALRVCRQGGALEAVPRPRLELRLPDVKRRLEAEGIEVLDARVMLIVQLSKEATIARDGRILIKSSEPKEAGAIFERLRALLDLPPMDSP